MDAKTDIETYFIHNFLHKSVRENSFIDSFCRQKLTEKLNLFKGFVHKTDIETSFMHSCVDKN